MNVRHDDLLRLLHLVGITEDDEIDCTEFVHRVAGYLERVAADAVAPEDARIVQHLKVCPECLEEYEALFAAARRDGGPRSADDA